MKSPSWVATVSGIVSSKVVPSFFLEVSRILPLIDSTELRTMSSPMPLPDSRVGLERVEKPGA